MDDQKNTTLTVNGLLIRTFTYLIIACLTFLIISCSDNSGVTNQSNLETDEMLTSELPNHNNILRSGALRTSITSLNNSKGRPTSVSDDVELTSPLFGLATAPNGAILVADAGSGIVSLDGRSNMPLAGVSDVAPIGRNSMWAIKGLSGAPGSDTGQALYRVSKGNQKMLVDLFDFEEQNNPAGGSVDSNPFDVHSLGGRSALVADAGANDLLKINNRGDVEVIAIFPDELVSTSDIKNLLGCPGSGAPICGAPPELPAQPVSTSIAVGPDGHYYVGELKGFPAPLNESNIWRISPDASGVECGTDAGCEKAFDGGFTSIIDLAFDEDGYLYVVELDENSWFALEIPPGSAAGGTINKCDLDAGTCVEIATGIPIVTAITFGKDGSLWATRNSLIPGAAEVFEVQ